MNSVILLILTLVFIGYSLHNHRFNKKFPPIIGECPDFWVAEKEKCKNPKNLGNCRGVMNFKTTLIEYVGDSSWVENTIMEAKSCLTNEYLLAGADDCDSCRYFLNRKKMTTSLKECSPT